MFCAGDVNKGNSEKIDEVDQESNKGGEQTENQTAGAYSRQAMPRDKYKEKRKMVGRGFRKEWLKEFPWLQYKEEQSLNFVMFLLWIVENMFLSFLESKILLWKVNFHIYFPQWQVTSKVSVEPWGGRGRENS